MVTALAALAGGFGSLDTALNIAFPDLLDDLGLVVADLRWVIIVFVATYGSLLVGAGLLGDRFDHRRVLLAGAAGSALALVACAVAPTYGLLLVGRLAQGVTTALVMAGAPALLSGLGGTASASVFQTAAAIGLTVGPILGGPLVAVGGWRAVFWFRVPLAAVLVVLAWSAGRRSIEGRAPGGSQPPSSIRSMATRRAERTGPRPRSRSYLAANLLTALVNGAVFVIWFLVPTLLVDEVGVAVGVGGLILALSPLATALASAAVGTDRWTMTDRSTGRVGIAAVVAGLTVLALTPIESTGPASIVVAAALVVAGAGLGLFAVPNMATVMTALPGDRQGLAGGITLTMRTVGIVASVNAAGLLFGRLRAAGVDETGAFRLTTASAAIVAAVALGVAVWSGRVVPAPDRSWQPGP